MLFTTAALLTPLTANALPQDIWSVETAHQALRAGKVVILDIRSREEW